jgi:hypothetical protein
LDAALSHVADTSVTRAQISYDDTAELVRLSGTDPGNAKGFAVLRGWGASSIAQELVTLPSDTGISLFSEEYAISAGNPPRAVTLLHGGQTASLVTSRLTKLGWKQKGGMLTGPAFSAGVSQAAALYALQLHVVRADGSDVALGGTDADLSQIGSPSGSTLVGDPLIGALAGCLGDVIAAQVSAGDLGGRNPVAVAIGVRTPASNAATPHAVACVAWSGQAGAAQYAADVRKALSSGVSYATNQPYSALLSHPSVTSIGGSQHIVQWQADTPGRADLIFQMFLNRDLPALPYCGRLTPAVRSRVIGCA